MDMIIGLSNQFTIWKNIGISIGIMRYNNFTYLFDYETGFTEFAENNYDLTPFLTIDVGLK